MSQAKRALSLNKRSIVFIGSCLLMSQLLAFDIDGTKWPGAKTDFYVSIDGKSPSGVLWNTAFIGAAQNWNQSTDFTFNVFEAAEDPCRLNSPNGIAFASDACGSAFGESTLAVTFTRVSSQVLGPPAITHADILVNDALRYDIFEGRLVQFGIPFGSIDFRRMALHELGHVLGLDHSSAAVAIMSPSISNIDSLQEDDIAGVNKLYGGLQNCAITPLSFGTTVNSLSAGDCSVIDLTVGGADTSFIDVYRFDLEATTTVQFDMQSTALDSVLLLADADLNYLAFDDKSSGLCGSSLSTTLQPGNYFILGNTYDEPSKPECGNSGSYVLEASFNSSEAQSLGSTVSLLGGAAAASFAGGITDDKGLGFGNKFSPTSSLDIEALITVDPLHVGKPGFLIAAAVLNNEIFFLNSAGFFVDAPETGFINAASKLLATSEPVILASNLLPSELGIKNIEVDFWVGYGLSAQPDEIFFHQLPINLVVSP